MSTPTPKESYDHALHNEQACDYLALNGKFPDWTITTAFYSSLHFVTSKIFPFDHSITGHQPKKIGSIEEWQSFKNYMSNKRHNLLSSLVAKFCPDISPDYDWLLDTSWNARYHHHQHDPAIVQKAVRLMKQIKEHCKPKTK